MMTSAWLPSVDPHSPLLVRTVFTATEIPFRILILKTAAHSATSVITEQKIHPNTEESAISSTAKKAKTEIREMVSVHEGVDGEKEKVRSFGYRKRFVVLGLAGSC
ncbi:hypothetical protein V6N13_083058 [Hibiscus sabdariffa]